MVIETMNSLYSKKWLQTNNELCKTHNRLILVKGSLCNVVTSYVDSALTAVMNDSNTQVSTDIKWCSQEAQDQDLDTRALRSQVGLTVIDAI